MTTILKQISLAFGALIFILVAVIGVARSLPFFVIFYRGIIAMSISTVIFLLFASFFQRLLYRFVAEQIMMQKNRDSGRRQDKSRVMPGMNDSNSAAPDSGGGSGAVQGGGLQ